MNPRPSLPRAVDLHQAMTNIELEEIVETALAGPDVKSFAIQAIDHELAEPSGPSQPPAAELEEERQRLLDAALADAIEIVNRHRLRHGRRVCSKSDATITRKVFELLRGMADAAGGADNDPSFQ